MKLNWMGMGRAGTTLGTLALAGYGTWICFSLSDPASRTSVSVPLDPHSARPSVYLAQGDGAAISQAILSLPPEGGSVVLGGFRFLVRQPIVIDRDGVELRGTGPMTTLKLADDANCSVVIVGSVSTPIPRIVKDVSVRHLTIDGNREAQAWECCADPATPAG